MDRSLWLSLLLVTLSLALVITGRAAIEGSRAARAAGLTTEIEALAGGPSSLELAERVTDAAGCIRGYRPPIRSCWYVWARPTRPDYLLVVTERVQADATRETAVFAVAAIPLWVLTALFVWKATRPRRPLRERPRATVVAAASPPGPAGH